MVNTWFVVIPAVNVNSSTAEKELVDFREQYQPGTSEYNAAIAGKAFNDPNLGQLVIKWKGPFATEAQAQTAQAAKQQSPNPVNDAVNAAENSTTGPTGAILAIWSKLNDRGTWIRVAEVTLGISLVLVALAHMTGAARVIDLPASLAKQAGKTAKVTK
jgi:hypothetical protein